MDLRRLVGETSVGSRFTVYVKPGSKDTVLKLERGELVFYTEEEPIKGRANASLIKYLSKNMGIPSSKIEIVHGIRSRVKTVLVRDLRGESLVELLEKIVVS